MKIERKRPADAPPTLDEDRAVLDWIIEALRAQGAHLPAHVTKWQERKGRATKKTKPPS